MERYNYLEAVKDDVREWISNEITINEWYGRQDELENKLYEDCWIADSVTGNASGSYTFNAWKAEEYLCHNMELLEQVQNEFGKLDFSRGAEYCDVCIRCFLLGQAISEVLTEFEEILEEGSEEIDTEIEEDER